ncbi:uridine kinase family protein [Nesterenkonia ebinurensis]|uniref:uridine kinase family protein n=1 Tax=Nesterenkonia ebinurensis TaxID=2608252 RepID=UPI00123D0A4E|nr:phosphoglycerate transporter [Nesterenkonia ebinurensis]
MEFTSLVEHITQAQQSASRPIVVGISGYAGSGKSTLARRLVEAVPGAARVRGDDFLNPVLSHHRSQDWAGVERIRLTEEVLKPIREQQPGTFRRFDWSCRTLGDPEPLPDADVLVVDLIGLFHPEALEHLDITVWCDIDLSTAVQRGMARDRELGRMHDTLWLDVWEPNERDFAERFAPAQKADVRFSTAGPVVRARPAGRML